VAQDALFQANILLQATVVAMNGLFLNLIEATNKAKIISIIKTNIKCH
jgi:hypothetical protein